MTEPTGGLVSAPRRRVGWGLADQAVSSLTNFAVGIAVARTLGPGGFGSFSIAFAVYVALLGATRGLTSEPLTVRFSTADAPRWRGGTARATGAALAIGAGAGLLVAAVGTLVPGETGAALLALAVCLPGLLVQDSWRYAFLARGTGGAAFANDCIWAAALAVLLGAALMTDSSSVALPVLAWGAAATVAAVVGVVQARLVPRPVATSAWLREHRDIAGRFAAESGSLTAGQQASVVGIAAVADLAAVGTLRAGQIILGPVQTVYLGVHLVAVPEAARLLGKGRDLLRPAVALSALLAVLALLAGAVVLAVPQSLGEAVLAQTWEPARSIVAPLSLALAAAGAAVGPLVALRAMAAARYSLPARLLVTVTVVLAEIGGAAVGGAAGAAWGSAGAMWIGVALWWRQLAAARRVITSPSTSA